MRFVVWVVVNALALATAAWLLDGITVTGDSTGRRVLTMLVVGLIFGLVNGIIAPVVKLLSLPFILLTLGLLIFVINALMLLLTSWIAGLFDVGFHVDGFWTAVLGAIIVSIATWVLELILPGDR
ncbi:MAG: phage holin family protein [Nocardioidaceae bacterium]|nr:phage holin family protein [Nocardioidaceae bacterium]NUS52696.1 phage holin family protein [Nocardioidaceae bacterium]